MSGGKCSSCGLIAFAGQTACRRCNAPIADAQPQAFAPPQFAHAAPPPAAPSGSMTGRIIGIIIGGAIASGVAAGIGGALSRFSYKPEWRDFRSDGYVVSMPKSPEQSTQTQHSEAGDATIRLQSAEFGRNGGFITAYVGFPPPQRMVTPEEMLDAMANGAVERAKIKVRHRVPIQLDQYRGIEIEGVTEGPGPNAGVETFVRIYWAPPQTAYMVSVVAPKNSPVLADKATFFDSFHIGE